MTNQLEKLERLKKTFRYYQAFIIVIVTYSIVEICVYVGMEHTLVFPWEVMESVWLYTALAVTAYPFVHFHTKNKLKGLIQ